LKDNYNLSATGRYCKPTAYSQVNGMKILMPIRR